MQPYKLINELIVKKKPHAEQKKPDTKKYMQYDSVYTKLQKKT